MRETAVVTGADEALLAEIDGKLLRAEYKRPRRLPGSRLAPAIRSRPPLPITNSFHTGQ